MGSRIVAAAIGMLACAGVAPVRAEEPAEPPPSVVPADRLPVLGLVGDYPPAGERVIVEFFAGSPPRLVVDGKQFDLPGFQKVLRARGENLREPGHPEVSTLALVVRADRAVRWQDTQWLLQAAAAREVGVYRVFFAARPEVGDEEGAIALFLPFHPLLARSTGSGVEVLPLDGGKGPRIPVSLLGGSEGSVDPALAAWSRLHRMQPADVSRMQASIAADPDVATGAVLGTVDMLLRSGVDGVFLAGTKRDPGTAPRAVLPTGSLDRPRLRIFDETIHGIADDVSGPRPLARMIRGYAGQFHNPLSEYSIGIGHSGAPAFGGRRGGHRNLKGGPTQETENAVFRGLEWLKAHQSEKGLWDCDGFDAACGAERCGGGGGTLYDVGVTGLATLAFLGYGETHKTPRYGHVVRNALKFLKNAQDAEGCFGPRSSPHFTYNHAIATLAMVEAYGLTQSPLFKSSAQNGVNFILQCRNPGLAWRYGIRPQDNDTSITGWMVMALKSAKSAGLDVPDDAFQGAVAWLDRVTDPGTGRAGYTQIGNGPARSVEQMEQFPSSKSESLTAIAVLARIFSGAKRDDPMVAKGAALCLASLPKHDPQAGTIDHTYWHFGTLAMFQVGVDAWDRWHAPVKDALLAGQRKEEGHARGSWDPNDPWGGEGGRIYSTALGVLSLEVYYRYARVFPK